MRLFSRRDFSSLVCRPVHHFVNLINTHSITYTIWVVLETCHGFHVLNVLMIYTHVICVDANFTCMRHETMCRAFVLVQYVISQHSANVCNTSGIK